MLKVSSSRSFWKFNFEKVSEHSAPRWLKAEKSLKNRSIGLVRRSNGRGFQIFTRASRATALYYGPPSTNPGSATGTNAGMR